MRYYETAPRPIPTDGQVLIRVHAAGVNPVDYKTRSGAGTARGWGDNPFPIILGWDIAGTVESAPEHSRFVQGDSVYGLVNFPKIGGAYAEYVAVNPDELTYAPKSIDLSEAASMPLDVLTAWQALTEVAKLEKGQTILIHGAARGIGLAAVQLATWRGAYVIGTALARNEPFLKEQGVRRLIDYRLTRFEDVVHDVDIVLDTLGGETLERSFAVVKRGGQLVTIDGQPSEELAKSYGIEARRMLVRPNGEQLAQISALIDKGVFRPMAELGLHLYQAAEAHRWLEDRHERGKIVLIM
jgi:NADPH:quinone reductase